MLVLKLYYFNNKAILIIAEVYHLFVISVSIMVVNGEGLKYSQVILKRNFIKFFLIKNLK